MCGHFFFLFHNENKNYIKVFVDPAIMINKSNIFFKKKIKKNDLEKEKRSVGFAPTWSAFTVQQVATAPRGICVCRVAK